MYDFKLTRHLNTWKRASEKLMTSFSRYVLFKTSYGTWSLFTWFQNCAKFSFVSINVNKVTRRVEFSPPPPPSIFKNKRTSCQVILIEVYRQLAVQFGTQVKLRWSRGRKDRTAEDAFSAPWYFSEMELEPAAG